MTEPDTTLWAVHVVGPDDLIAKSSKHEAQNLADEINGLGLMLVSAEVAEWPYDSESHAEELAKAGLPIEVIDEQ